MALCEREKDTSGLKRIEKFIRENERKQRNLMNAVSECEIESVRKSLYAEISRLCTELDTLKSEYAIEKAGTVSLTITEVKFFLSQLRKGKADDLSYRKTLINVFVNAIYLYDDRLVIFFNSGDKPVTIDDDLLDKTEEGDGFVFGASCSTILESRLISGFPYFYRYFNVFCNFKNFFLPCALDAVLLTSPKYLLTKALTKMLKPVGYSSTGSAVFEKNPLNSSAYFDTSCLAIWI